MARKRRPRKAPATETAPTKPKRSWAFTDPQNLLPWAFTTLALAIGVFTFDNRLGLSGDNAEFIVLGRSIAEGHGLTYICSPDMTPATKYPFGFPLLLALVHLVLPHSVLSMKLLVMFTFVAAIPLLYLYVRRHVGLLPAVLVTATTISSHFVLDFSHQIMSEIPYLLVSLVALAALEHSAKQPSRRSLALAVLAVMCAYYMRTVGIALIAGGAAYFALNRRYCEGGLFLGGSLLLALPWQIRTSLLGGESYAQTWLFRVNPYRADDGEIGWFGLVLRVLENAQVYMLGELPRALFPPWIGEGIPIVVSLTISALLVYYIATQIHRGQLTGLYLLLYLGACFLWPTVWADVRLLTPVLPLVFLGIISAAGDLLSRFLSPRATELGLGVIALAIAVPNIQAVAILANQEHRYPPEWSTYFEAARWIEQNTPEDAIVACRKAYLMSVISKRQTTSYTFTEDFDTVLADLQQGRATHIVLDQLQFSSTSRYLIPTIERHRDQFSYVHHIPDPDTFILRVE